MTVFENVLVRRVRLGSPRREKRRRSPRRRALERTHLAARPTTGPAPWACWRASGRSWPGRWPPGLGPAARRDRRRAHRRRGAGARRRREGLARRGHHHRVDRARRACAAGGRGPHGGDELRPQDRRGRPGRGWPAPPCRRSTRGGAGVTTLLDVSGLSAGWAFQALFGVDLRVDEARRWRSSGPTGPASRRCCARSPASSPPPVAPCGSRAGPAGRAGPPRGGGGSPRAGGPPPVRQPDRRGEPARRRPQPRPACGVARVLEVPR